MPSKINNQRILFVAPDPGAGGSTKAILPVLRDLHQRGYKLLVMIPSEGYFSQTLRSIGIKYIINPYISLCLWPTFNTIKDIFIFLPRIIVKLIKLLIEYIKTLKVFKIFRPTLIYTNTSLILSGYLVAKKYSIPHIWHVHEYGDKDFGFINFPSHKSKKKRLSSTHSISITKQIYDHYHLYKHGIIIYNGVKSVSQLKAPNQLVINTNKYILFVGHITEMKGATDLINAFVKYCIQGGKLNLILCGNIKESYKNQLVMKTSQYNLTERVTFTGQINNVDTYMSNAEALIVPSKYEAFGLITSEAMFNQCLIIGRNTGGTKEQFDLGLEQTGHEIGLRFNTIDELTTCIHQIETMEQMIRNTYTAPAYTTAINNFTIEKYTNNIHKYISSIIERSRD